MEIKRFYRTQRDLACAINYSIDAYWNDKLSEESLEITVKELFENNKNKLIKGQQFTTIIQQQCGKRRLEIVSKVLGLVL